MDKTKASKKPTPSLRTKKKGTDRQKSTSRPSSCASKNASSTKQAKKDPSQHSKRENKNAGRSVMVMDREPVTDNDNKNKKVAPPPKKEMKKKAMSAEAEKKLDRTQDDVPDVKQGATTETISNIEVIPDKNPAKMDDGYEDFGPGAAS